MFERIDMGEATGEAGGSRSPATEETRGAKTESLAPEGLRDFTESETMFLNSVTSSDRIPEHFISSREFSPAEEELRDSLLAREEKINRLQSIRTLPGLIDWLRSVKGIHAGATYYTAHEIEDTIGHLAEGIGDIDMLPDVFDLREKVAKLLADEVVNQPLEDLEPTNGDTYAKYFLHTDGISIPVEFKGMKVRVISEGQWKKVKRGIPQSVILFHDQQETPFGGFPKIGATGLGTKFGTINGPLVWCDSYTAIFETPEGYLMVPFSDLIGPSGKTYREVEAEIKEAKKRGIKESETASRKRREQEPKSRYMSI